MTAAEPETTVDNPFFARLWIAISGREVEAIRKLRRENLTGLTGRVLEIGAGTGTNFAYYPPTVAEVTAIEPEPRLRRHAEEAAAQAPVPVTVTGSTIETFSPAEPFDAIVASLVLCSVQDPDAVVAQLFTLCKAGGELRFLEHVASAGLRGRMQQVADATVWPRLIGNCHTHRDTPATIAAAGFTIATVRHEWTVPAWVPMPVSEHVIGRAVKRAAA